MSTPTAPQVLTDEERTTAIGLARYAYEYIDAANLVDDHEAELHPGSQISPTPAYFLAVHGIELTLKAFLRHHGVTVRELGSKKYGHDLHACYRKAKELGLLKLFKEHANDVDAMRMLVDLNQGHGLRYIRTGAKQFPLWSIVYPLAARLHQAVAPAVGCKKTFTMAFGGYQ
jgi:hypothetical protein